ncbi:MAG: hypothetical protein KF704_00530 [Crocinitomicaceae bacterium]|nr:hypothetical protein [Crocinitomicaceae bacterium]NGF75131.1 hypothetical protein [Fluviicola sp. SGL-29]
MKAISYLIIILSTALSYGQKTFTIQSAIGDGFPVEINGRTYRINSTEIHISTNYPNFDTLAFLNEGPDQFMKVLCNFKPDSNYSLTVACCGSMDIVPTHKLQTDKLLFWDNEEDHEEVQALLMDKPHISLQLTQASEQPVYGWYADMACFTRYKQLTTTKWEYGTPEKCFYWNNVSTFLFFESENTCPDGWNEQGECEAYPDEAITVLGSVTYRLFDNERVVISYDPVSKKISLAYAH